MPVSPFRSEAARAAVMEIYERRLAAWPAPVREIDLPTPGGRTHVIASGPEAASPVILLHGGQANAMMWQPYAKLLPELRLFALDAPWAPGKGEFDGQWPESPAAWIGSVLDGLSLPRAALLGFSMGGALAMASLGPLGDRVAALVCISSGPGGFAPKPALILPSLVASVLKTRGAYRRLIRLAAPTGRMDAETVEYLLCIQKHCEPVSRPGGSHPALPGGTVETPALFLFGGRDVTFDAARAAALVGECFSRASVATLPEAGHLLLAEMPETAFGRIAEFLRRTEGTA